MKKKVKNLTLLVLLTISQMGCNDWLDVTPSTEIRVSDQVKSVEGFSEILNGVYIAMGQRELYGEHLMFGDIEFLAQNYHPDNFLSSGFESYDYSTVASMERYESYWDKLYNAIANVNIILDNIDQQADLFIEDDYSIMKGEALALRAFLHFDVLRLFGEDYSEETRSNVQLPYVTSADLVRFPHLSLDSVYLNLFTDLNQAQTLLAAYDPQVASYNGFLFATDRVYHLNYHAVNALKARVFITRGTENDHDSAYYYSNKVLSELSWSFASPADFSTTGAQGDPLLSSEIIWALNVSGLPSIHQETFGSISPVGGYSTANDPDFNGAEKIFDIINIGAFDRRYIDLLVPDPEGYSQHSVSRKYDQEEITLTDFYDHYSVPMFRISEMHLTKAEAILETNRNETITLMNELKTQRDVQIPDPNYTGWFNPQLLEELVREYRKELLMEGQTFFIYKRLGYTEIPDGETFNGVINMLAENYILPIPFDEQELGNR